MEAEAESYRLVRLTPGWLARSDKRLGYGADRLRGWQHRGVPFCGEFGTDAPPGSELSVEHRDGDRFLAAAVSPPALLVRCIKYNREARQAGSPRRGKPRVPPVRVEAERPLERAVAYQA